MALSLMWSTPQLMMTEEGEALRVDHKGHRASESAREVCKRRSYERGF